MQSLPNPLYNPIVKIDRLLSVASELRRSVIEENEQIIITGEKHNQELHELTKKLIAQSNCLEDEIKLNTNLLKDIRALKDRIYVLNSDLGEMETIKKKLEARVKKLYEWKLRKRNKFKLWIRRRLK